MVKQLGGARAYREFILERFADKQSAIKCAVYPKTSLYIHGPTGCGKTHLATAIIRQLYPHCEILKPMDIFREVRGCESVRQENTVLERLSSVNLLIDDLGVEKGSDFALQTIYEIMDKRWMSGAGGLIITSNLDLDGLSRKLGDDRIVSRIAGMCRIVALKGKDYRLGMQQ